jgi:hypothetical protein
MPIYNLGMILRSEGRFTAPPFDRVVIVRIYQEEDGFHIHAKPWFGRTYDSKLVEICGPMREPPERTLEFAKDRAKHAIEGNIGAAFGTSYLGRVDWNDGVQYLQLLKPLCKREDSPRRSVLIVPGSRRRQGETRYTRSVDDGFTAVQLAELRKKLSTMSVTAVMDAYRSAYFQCKLEGDQIPPARAVQILVQAWKEMRGWSEPTVTK